MGNKSPEWLTVEDPDGNLWDPTDLEARLAPLVHQDFQRTLKIIGWFWIGFAGLILLHCHLKGRRLSKDRIERGKRLVTDKEIRHLISRSKSKYTIGGVPIVRESEVQHTLILGAPGTGKTTIFLEVLDVVRKLMQRAIVYDPTGEFYSIYGRPGDILLNPLDSRHSHWTPWSEIRRAFDADNMAKFLIPRDGNAEPFWEDAARTILAAALNRIPKHSVDSLISHLCTTKLIDLARLTKGTDAAALLSPENPKLALSVQATTTTYTRALRYLWAGDQPSFSIRDWISRDDDASWLFLSAPAAQRAALKPLLTCWLECAAIAALTLEPSHTRRLFFAIDELPTLHKLDAIPTLLAQGRKFGVAGVLGLQSFSQLKVIYGKDGLPFMAPQPMETK